MFEFFYFCYALHQITENNLLYLSAHVVCIWYAVCQIVLYMLIIIYSLLVLLKFSVLLTLLAVQLAFN